MASLLNSRFLRRLLSHSDIFIALAIVSIIFIIIIPIPALLLDILFTFSITFSLVILLLTMFTTETLQFSVFPSLLLVATLFRLSLNVSSTRLILRDAAAGDIINAFGNFVVGGDYVVGFVIFLIITLIQFLVITNGAGRVAEVAARFTLDAMPGKQMSIDADFNAGLIDEATARERRMVLQQEADFYGSMDGASKFVKGDAIAGLIIVLVNIVGGLAIGVIKEGYPIEQAIQVYTLLTVGDGLVSQIPAILISTAAGILITRSANQRTLGQDLSSQLLGFPKVIAMSAGIVLVLGLIPGLPFFPFFILAVGSGFASYLLLQEEKSKAAKGLARERVERERLEPENFHGLVSVNLLELELGYNLLQLTEKESGGDLLDRITAARRQFALEAGLVVQPIRIRDNLQLAPNRYVIKLKGNFLASGELQTGHFLAMNPGGLAEEIEGIPTKEPTFGLEALWIEKDKKDDAEMAGYTVVDDVTVLITHLTEVIRNHAHELLGRQEVKLLIDNVRENQPAVVEELIPNMLSVGDVQKVLQNLLKEKIPIRDMVTILETLADHASESKNMDYLTEMVRQSMSRTICSLFSGENNKLYVLTLDPELEQKIADSLQQTPQGTYPILDPGLTQKIFNSLVSQVEKMTMKGRQPIALVSPRIRLPLRRLLERSLPQVILLSFNEIISGVEVEALGVVNN
ncbi:MAG: flagellar biosynthesis protein FlhA [Dethiobacter sp.]|jgi:flagellar biosynthesis protein FlhA|nr:MAG: flagellar biosynthesis protein FlhA [Dethiobacter sp.]